MKAGKLKHKIELQKNVPVADKANQKIPVWTTIERRWCRITPMTARELKQAEMSKAEVDYKLIMRYDNTLAGEALFNFRFKYGDIILEVVSSINVEEESKEWEILCKETV